MLSESRVLPRTPIHHIDDGVDTAVFKDGRIRAQTAVFTVIPNV